MVQGTLTTHDDDVTVLACFDNPSLNGPRDELGRESIHGHAVPGALHGPGLASRHEADGYPEVLELFEHEHLGRALSDTAIGTEEEHDRFLLLVDLAVEHSHLALFRRFADVPDIPPGPFHDPDELLVLGKELVETVDHVHSHLHGLDEDGSELIGEHPVVGRQSHDDALWLLFGLLIGFLHRTEDRDRLGRLENLVCGLSCMSGVDDAHEGVLTREAGEAVGALAKAVSEAAFSNHDGRDLVLVFHDSGPLVIREWRGESNIKRRAAQAITLY